MIKNVVINPTLTPAPKVDFTNGILGRVLEPQTRWSPGNLMAAVLSGLAVDCLSLINKTQLVVLEGDFTAALAALNLGGKQRLECSSVEGGTGKNRVVEFKYLDNGGGMSTLSHGVSEQFGMTPGWTNLVVDEINRPELPTYSPATLVTALDAFYGDEDYLIVFDQVSGTFVVVCASGVPLLDSNALIASAIAAAGSTVVSAFLTSPNSSAPVSPGSAAWE